VDYNVLLDLTVTLGYRLAMAGAETFRVEETVNRVMHAYGISAEAFVIPNCLHVSIETAQGQPMTRMRRIGYHGNDLDAVEKYNHLSRRICAERPDPQVAMQWLKETENTRRQYSLTGYLIGNFLGACGFSVIFGGSLMDSFWAGVCGLLVGLVNKFMDNLKLAAIATHVADARTCVLHPASHTHRQLSDEQLRNAGIQPDLIRFSVGIEDAKDIIADLKQAFQAIK
jgi:uncharacterized membrane protein YjjP (DUF1212 family)